MPYFNDINLKDDEQQTNNNPTQIQISGASPTTDNSGNMISSSPGSTNAGDTQKQLVTGSGYQNLDKYLNTNNAQQFGNQFYGNVQNDIDSAKKNQDSSASQFQDQVKGASQTPDMSQVNSEIANPTGADAKQFQGWENQTYQGPNNLAESPDLYNQYWSGTQKANTNATLSGSEPGRFTLLDSYFGKPDYSYGQKSLDNLLVQQSGLGQTQKGLQTQASQLTSAGNSQSNALTNQASQAAGQVENSAQNVRNAIGVDSTGQVVTDPTAAGYGALGSQYTAINNATTQTNSDRAAQLAQINSDLTSGRISSDELGTLGIPNNLNTYNIDPTQYISAGNPLDKTQVMTPEQQAYIQALSQLSGVTDTFASGNLSKAPDPYTFFGDKFKNDVNQAQLGLQSGYSNLFGAGRFGPQTGDGVNLTGNALTDIPGLLAYKSRLQQNPNNINNQQIAEIDRLLPILSQYGIDPTTGTSKQLGNNAPKVVLR